MYDTNVIACSPGTYILPGGDKKINYNINN